MEGMAIGLTGTFIFFALMRMLQAVKGKSLDAQLAEMRIQHESSRDLDEINRIEEEHRIEEHIRQQVYKLVNYYLDYKFSVGNDRNFFFITHPNAYFARGPIPKKYEGKINEIIFDRAYAEIEKYGYKRELGNTL